VLVLLPQWRFVIVLLFLIGWGSGAAAQEALDDKEVGHAIAVGRSCHAPIVRVTASVGDFDVYVESPFARVAVVAATALMMHERLDAPGVRRAMQPGYRIWLWHKRDSRRRISVSRLSVRSHYGEVQPVAERRVTLFLGTVPSHGIIPPLRQRYPEFLFDSLPKGDFEIVLRTNEGLEHYRISEKDRTKLIPVCNEH
jgi:hypothetical protein